MADLFIPAEAASYASEWSTHGDRGLRMMERAFSDLAGIVMACERDGRWPERVKAEDARASCQILATTIHRMRDANRT